MGLIGIRRWFVSLNSLGRRLVFVAGLLIFFALAVQAAVVKSVTADEVVHLLRGRTVWQTGDMALQGQHTPLSHWLIGALMFTEPTAPDVETLTGWDTRNADQLISEFLWQGGTNVERLLFLGRLPIIMVGLLLGAVVVSWMGRKKNRWGQVVVLCLFAFSPNVLAFAALATTDLVAAATIVAALFVLWTYWQRPSRPLWLLVGVMLGLALGAKLTAVFLLPVTLLLCYFSAEDRRWWRPGLVWLSFLPVAGLVMWALYGFEIGPVDGLPFSIPAATYVSNFVAVSQHIERGHYSFLLGDISNEGWWYYFAVALLVKMPSTVLLLLGGAIFIIVRGGWLRRSVYFWLPAGSLFVAASVSGLNIGFRHILAVVPLVWLFIGEAVPWLVARRRLAWLVVVGLSWYGLASLVQQPDNLAFFNRFVGGSGAGYRILGDSNLDWGQDLGLLVDYIGEHGDKTLFVSYFGAADADYYGLDRPPLYDDAGMPLGFSPANPAPGRYLLSVNLVQSGITVRPDLFDWFRGREPVDTLGYSILVYDVAADDEGDWVAHCFDPEPLVDEDAAELFVGRDSLRHVYFDCRSSWVIPGAGQGGWYVLPADVSPTFSEMVFPEGLRLVYESTNQLYEPSYRVYYWSGGVDTAEGLVGQSLPVTTGGEAAISLPILADDFVRFLGGFSGGGLWGSAWEVVRETDRNLSVQLHLYGEEGGPLVGDGLGYSVVQWQPGDVFVQFHREGGEDGRYLETSLYELGSGERLMFENGATSVRVLREEEG